MSNSREEASFLDQEFGSSEMDDILNQQQQDEAQNPITEKDLENNKNDPAENFVEDDEDLKPLKNGKKDEDDQGSDDEELAQNDQNKTMNEQERYKAMAEEERIRRKEVQKQIETLNAENKKLKDTFDRILQKAQEQAELESQPKPPSYDENPIEALKYENEQLKKKFGNIEQSITQKQQQEQQEYEIRQKQDQFIGTYKAKADEFSKTTPDFKDAYNYLLTSRQAEYKAAGYSDEQVNQLLVEDEAAIVATALGQNANPAQRLYEIAKLRGYKQNSNINGQDKIQANNEKIANLERGLKASKSVNSGGMSAKDHLTLEDVAEMSDDDLDKVDWNKLMRSG